LTSESSGGPENLELQIQPKAVPTCCLPKKHGCFHGSERILYIVTERILTRVSHASGPPRWALTGSRSRSGICVLALCLLMPTSSTSAQGIGSGGNEAPTTIARSVLDIISFARWPTQPDVYRLCVAGRTTYLNDTLIDTGTVSGHPIRSRDLELLGDSMLSACDVVYIGSVVDATRKHLLTGAAGQPILTIDEAGATCSSGAMFCLRVHDNRVSLRIDLDAISRSGVRINPNVLLLARRKSDQP
jgi:hypothetical protein